MKEKVMDILMDLRPDVDFENEKKLIGDGILESFDIMSLVAELEDEFDVKIKPKDLVAENFNSVDDMVAILQFCNIPMASSITIITMTKKRAQVLQKQGRLTV